MRETQQDRLMGRLRKAFLDHGYEQLTMTGLAKACDLTRRALYNHVNNKEAAFREMLRWRHRLEIEAGLAAGERWVDEGGSALDALVAVFDARYGEARRDLEHSPHALEINREAFLRCHDVMAESASAFHDRLAEFLTKLAAKGLLELDPAFPSQEIAQLLADGARGVNQTLPSRPASTLPARYRRMCAAVLYGCALRR